MDDKEVSSGSEIWFQILWMLAVLLVQFIDICLISCFGEPAFFVQQGQDTHGFLNQVNGGLKIQSEINELPFDSFLLVLFLQKKREADC